MKEMKHTPGPWRIGTAPPNGEQAIGTIRGMMVAVATTGVGMENETLANARLIAEAPEMLQALRSIAAITTCADQDQDAMCAEIQGICRIALAALEPGERA